MAARDMSIKESIIVKYCLSVRDNRTVVLAVCQHVYMMIKDDHVLQLAEQELSRYFTLFSYSSVDDPVVMVLAVVVTIAESIHTNFGGGFHVMVMGLTRISFFQGTMPVNE